MLQSGGPNIQCRLRVVSADAEYGAQGILSVVTTEAPRRTAETLLHGQVAGPVRGGATMKPVRLDTATARPPIKVHSSHVVLSRRCFQEAIIIHILQGLASEKLCFTSALRVEYPAFPAASLSERVANHMADNIDRPGDAQPGHARAESGTGAVDKSRRRTLIAWTGVAGAVAGIGVATPFVMSMFPSARARAAGAPVEVDISKLEPGMMITEEWRGKPVWILHRTEAMIERVPATDNFVADPNSRQPMQPDYARNELRSIKPDYLVLVGICTHLGCSPSQKLEVGEASGLGADWKGGFFCPCHGSKFDLAGRVYKGVPAPTNLEVPPHTYLSDARLLIGEDSKGS